jgi:hypothetical protein
MQSNDAIALHPLLYFYSLQKTGNNREIITNLI